MEHAVTGDPYWEALAQDARGNITQFRLGNGVESWCGFDAETRLFESADAGVNVVQDLAFTFDALGNLITASRSPRPSSTTTSTG